MATAPARVGADLTSDDQAYSHASCNKLGQHYGMLNKQFYLGTYFAPHFDVIPGGIMEYKILWYPVITRCEIPKPG